MISVFSLLDVLLMSEPMLEFESVTSEFSLALTIKYESKPYAVGLLNVIFV